jgi:uncharacterized protein YndB with AHSA1/START domain
VSETHRLERDYDTGREEIWDLWTTPEGIESWWAPEGFEAKVDALELRPGGRLTYTLTATGPEQVEFMRNAGMPLSTRSQKTFKELDRPERLAYLSLIDFVPGVPPYEHLTVVDLEEAADGKTHVVMTVDALHDAEWTQRLLAGRGNELDNLARLLESRSS